MSYKKKLEFANYTCTFGDELKLLDLFNEVVRPSFFSKQFIRYLRGTNYFFIDVELVDIKASKGKETDDVLLTGRLVKNTKLKREQIYIQGKGIVQDEDELETAPTSLFVLSLKTHRLIYMKEVSGAPDLKTFETTSNKFLNQQHKLYLEKLYNDENEADDSTKPKKRVTKKSLVERFPYPDLRITTLTDPTNLKSFVNQFEKIHELTIKLVPTNNEDIDNDDFWNQLNDSKNRMGSRNVVTKFYNKKDGLEDGEVFTQTSKATELANSEINIKGLDHSGGELNGDNDSFQLTVEMDEVSNQVKPASKSLYSEFKNQVSSGNISLPAISQAVLTIIRNIVV